MSYKPQNTNNINGLEMSDDESDSSNSSYLDKLEKKKIERLSSIRNNISKYMEDIKPKNATQSYQSTYGKNPIMPINFDKLFLNLNQISKIYVTSDYDRAVFYLSDSRRFIYKINSKHDKELIEKIIKFISHPVKVIVICDKTVFTDKFGFLYSGE